MSKTPVPKKVEPPKVHDAYVLLGKMMKPVPPKKPETTQAKPH